MNTYRHGSHSVFSIHLHIVWIVKYRRAILRDEVSKRVREVIREICRMQKVDIMRGVIAKNHVHLFISIPPQVTISRLVQRLKGRSSYALLGDFGHLRKQFWGRHLWARGYFCCSSGNVTDEMVRDYIENQTHDHDDDFQIE